TTATAASEKLAGELSAAKEAIAKLQEQYLGHLPGTVSKKLRALQETSEKLAEERVALTREVEAAKSAAEQSASELSRSKEESTETQRSRSEKEKLLKSLTGNREEARHALDALRVVEAQQLEAVKGQVEKRAKLEQARLKLVDQLARGQETVRAKSQMEQQEATRLATAELHLKEVESALAELPPPTPDEKPFSLDELKRTIAGLTSQLDGMGSVNLRAIEEYDGEKSRLDEFVGEVDRITTERTELEGLVHEVEQRKRVKISEVVDAINIAYREIYADLSGGGEGEIALESGDDPLAGGLLIKARPVGKNVQRLEQLSGGEKSLASLAFIFALQRYDPSPLYVFDEVDMSLDGVNAENVGRLLRRNAERAQFIVISLRKVTLKFAHRLFGVTMHGDGCSRVVGLKLDEIVDVDERDRLPEPKVALAPEAA
ncbi:MAG: AAA family ATPase, partial [Thermoplasmata archaeon]|nr:AAA family ATPase [Thermoplasmata archaeon]